MPSVNRNGLLTGTVVPLAVRKPAPRATPYMPSVPMKAGTRRRKIKVPLIAPGTRAASMAASRPTAKARPASTGVRVCIDRAMTTLAKPMTKPTERSIPPAMMTKVWPRPSSKGIAAETAMLCRL